MKELDRILGILLILQNQRRISARLLAERFAVSTRTIYRDLQTMSLLGIPIYAERGRHGGVRLLEGYFLPPLMFSRSEAIALLLGTIFLRTLRAVPFAHDVDTAMQKLLAAVPEQLRETLTRLGQIIGAEVPPADIFHAEPDEPLIASQAQRDGVTVTRFLQAILDGNGIRLEYQSPYRDTPITAEVDPRGLFWDRGRWYLATADQGEPTPRLWRANRVITIMATDLIPGRSNSFDVGEVLGHAWLKSAMTAWRQRAPVRLRVTLEQAQRLQQDWYYRFALYEPAYDGAVMMTIGERDPELVLALVRWLGPDAEIISPPAWRALLRIQLEAMLRSLDDAR
jgi:predicted DNA-binding transcriptional regulator YafY